MSPQVMPASSPGAHLRLGRRSGLVAAALSVALACVPAAAAPLLHSTGGGAHESGKGWIAFSSDQTGQAQIYLIRPDGSGRRPLFAVPGKPSVPQPDGFDDIQPSWSPDGHQLVFSQGFGYQSGNFGTSRIVIASDDGSRETVVYAADGMVSFRPAWSPDGSRIAFVTGDPSQGGLHLEMLDLTECGSNGCAATTVPLQAPGESAFGTSTYPAWSPDGRRLVFNGGSSGDAIYTVPATGGTPTRITPTDAAGRVVAGHDYSPAWSADGLIAYTHTGSGSAGKQLWVMNANGTDARAVRSESDGEDKFPAWSPDGDTIVYSHGTSGCQQPGPCTVTNDYQIYLIGEHGSSARAVTEVTVPETEFGESYPAWQPTAHP